MKNIDLLLVSPGGSKQIYQKLGSSLSAIEPPIWAGLIATFIQKHQYNVMILDTNAEGLDPEDAAKRTAEIDPLLIVVVAYGQNPSASTMVMPSVSAICKEIKKYSQRKVLLVGGHVAALPEQTLREENTDFVCDGEGPYTVLELLKELKSTQPHLNKVHGLLYHDNGSIVKNLPAPLVRDLDNEMPCIAWDLLPMDKYRAHNWHCFSHIDERQPYASLYTSLGCPYHCDFCCIQSPFKKGEQALGYSPKVNSYRCWHPDTVIDQIDILVNKYGVKNIKFADEIFVLNKNHVIGICDRIIERGYHLNIWAYARVDSWSDEMLNKMRTAGIRWLCLGFESGNKRVCDDVHKGYKHDKVFKTVESIKKAGIYIIANYLFGLPEEDYDSMQETLDMALNLNCEFANFYCAMAYPGSKLYEYAMKANLPLPDSWTGYSQHAFDTLPLPTKYLSGVDVLKFRDEAFHKYFSNQKYQEMILNTFGSHVVDSIKEMSSKKLDRKYV